MKVALSARIPANKVTCRKTGCKAHALSGKAVRAFDLVNILMTFSTPFARMGIALACAVSVPSSWATDEIASDIVVTATRRPISVDDSFQSVTVIGREEIEAANVQSLSDLLQGLAGVQVNRSGGPGRTTTVFLRGANANQTLVLVDGLRASALSNGEFDWNSIAPNQINRIEVVRGPLASLYGSDAIAGVIQIFTNRFQPGYAMEQTLGSYGTRKSRAEFSGGEEWKYAISAGTTHTDGLQNLVNNPKKYSFDQNSASLAIAREIDGSRQFKFNLNQNESKSALDRGPSSSSSFNRSFDYDSRVNDNWSYSVKVGWMGADLEVPFESPPGLFKTDRKSLALSHLLKSGDNYLTLGADVWSENVVKLDYQNPSNNLDKNLRNASIFGQYSFEWQKFNWQAALRHDRQNYYGRANTYNLAVSKDIAPGWRLSASHGTAFKAPTSNDLFWPHSIEANMNWDTFAPLTAASGTCGPNVFGNPVPCQYDTAGNPSLKPESSKTTEIGLRFKGDASFGLNYFETQVKDLINWDSHYAGAGESYTQFWFPNNLDTVRMRGLEIQYARKWNDWSLGTQWTALSAIDARSHQQLDRRPKQSAALTLGYRWADHLSRAELLMVSSRLNNSGADQLPGYVVANMSDRWQINPHWALVSRLDNVFDTRYKVVANGSRVAYATPARSAYLTLRYTMH
jgi:vitamin B12 transporter